jgi:hypothetical protein
VVGDQVGNRAKQHRAEAASPARAEHHEVSLL